MAMKNWFARIVALGVVATTFATGSAIAESEGVSIVESVEIKNGNRAEAIYYYENNWLSFRKEALELGYIDAYELVVSEESAADDAGIVLITHFESKAQFNDIEARFEKIMQGRSLRLLNDVQPGDFRQSVFVVSGERHRASE